MNLLRKQVTIVPETKAENSSRDDTASLLAAFSALIAREPNVPFADFPQDVAKTLRLAASALSSTDARDIGHTVEFSLQASEAMAAASASPAKSATPTQGPRSSPAPSRN